MEELLRRLKGAWKKLDGTNTPRLRRRRRLRFIGVLRSLRTLLDKGYPPIRPQKAAAPKPPPLPLNRLADEKTLGLFLRIVAARLGAAPIRVVFDQMQGGWYISTPVRTTSTHGPGGAGSGERLDTCRLVLTYRQLNLDSRKLNRSARWGWAVHAAAHQIQAHKGCELKHRGRHERWGESLEEARQLFRRFWEEVIEQPDLLLGAEHLAFLDKRHNRKAGKRGQEVEPPAGPEPAGE